MQIHGVDIETVGGNLKLLCTENRSIEPKTFEEIADFLLKGGKTNLYWTFNLQFDAEGMIKLLPHDFWLPLYNDSSVIYRNYKVTLFPKKFLAVAKLSRTTGKPTYSAKLYDVAQYYQGESLDSASRKYLNKQKLEGLMGENIGVELGKSTGAEYYEDNRETITPYCKNDAYLALELGKHMMGVFNQLGFPTKNPISCATISAKYVKHNYKYPQTDILPEEFHAFAFKSFRGGMFQTLQRGLFEQPLFDYDIK